MASLEGGFDAPRARCPPWRERRSPGDFVGVCHPVPTFLLSLRLPSTCPEPRTWDPPSLGSPAVPPPGSEHRVGGGEKPARLGRHILFRNIRGDEGQRCIGEKVRGCCGSRRGGVGGNAPFGPQLYCWRLPGVTAQWRNLPVSPRRACDPLAVATWPLPLTAWSPWLPSPRPAAAARAALVARCSRPVRCPRLAAPWRRPSRREGHRPEPGALCGGRAAPLEARSPLSASPNP